MLKDMRRVQLLGIVLLASCAHHRSEGARLREQDLARARSVEWHDPYYDEARSWEEMERHFLEWVDAEGVELQTKPPGDGRWSKAGTAFCHTILLPANFWTRPLPVRVRLEVHEAVHVRQCRDFGQILFGIRYADARFRWSVEANADRERLRAFVASGSNLDAVRADAVEQAEQLYDYYELGIAGLDRDHVNAVSRGIYLEVVPEEDG